MARSQVSAPHQSAMNSVFENRPPDFFTNGHPANNDKKSDKTLDLKIVAPSMRPSYPRRPTETLPRTVPLFAALTPSDQATLSLIECFAFQFRDRSSDEPWLLPPAALYIDKLSRMGSPLLQKVEQIIGFRCTGCRYTAYPGVNLYQPGAAHLIPTDGLTTDTVLSTLNDIRGHILSCRDVPENVKAALKCSNCKSVTYTPLGSYIDAWLQRLHIFSTIHGYPAFVTINGSFNLPQIPPGASHAAVNLGTTARTDVSGNDSSAMSAIPGMIYQDQHQRETPNYRTSATETDAEERFLQELDGCVSRAFASNNFGMAHSVPRTAAKDLTGLESAPDTVNSPFVELLLQCYTAVQQWRSRRQPDLNGSGKRMKGHFELDVRLECAFCKQKPDQNFCLVTSSSNKTARLLHDTCYHHLVEHCEKIPGNLRRKLLRLRPMNGSEECNKDLKVIEKHAEYWKAFFERHVPRHMESLDDRKYHTSTWRPLTWRMLHKKGAESIADEVLAYKGAQPVPASDAETLPSGIKDDDVLVGWNGSHVGNRRLCSMLDELRPAFFSEKVTSLQQRVIAFSVAEEIGSRGGRFYAIEANDSSPPTFLDVTRAAAVIVDAFTRGFIMMIQPPVDLLNIGQGCRVLEFDYAPQCSIYDEEIVRNKYPDKKPKFDE